ncbi:MAG: Uma2 family endonuclease [Phycisphaerae bacterium]|nr:Uma2 family endonuclease [Tepidisphaeraceae bacterium]
MTLLAPNLPNSFQPSPDSLRRFTVEEYHRMIDAGVFSDDEPVELLEGWIVRKMGNNPPHDVATKLVSQLLEKLLPPGWHSRVQSAIATGASEPLPDVAIVKGDIRAYAQRHPGPGDIGLLVEVADSSINRDRKEKLPTYANCAFPTYWIVNIQARAIEVYTEPTGKNETARYQTIARYGVNDVVPVILDGVQLGTIRVTDVLP